MSGNLSIEQVTGPLLGSGEAGPVLLGSRCVSCGEHYFPVTSSCTRCCGTELGACTLGGQGVLWSWTVQGFLPKSPYNSGESAEDFQPYGVGYIQLPCGLKGESRLTCADPHQWPIGMPMQLVEVGYGQNEGRELRTFAFAPVGRAVQETQ